MDTTRRTLRWLPLVLLALVLLLPVSPAGSAGRQYRVRSGDTLTSIAQRFKTTVAALARANHLDPNAILPIGKLLRLPAAEATAAQPTPPVTREGAFPESLRKRLTRALRPALGRATVGIAVLDLRTNRFGYVRNPDLPLEPASPEKLAVAYSALQVLGPGFRIETQVLGVGVRQGTLWRGNLVLVGHGDPTLSSQQLRLLASALRRSGIRSLQGSVVGDESYFDSARTVAGWKPGFLIGESPPLSALSVDRGLLDGKPAAKPALAAAILFTRALRGAGVRVSGAATTGSARADSSPLASVSSPTLAQIVRAMDVESDNFTAELLLKQLGARELGRGSSAAGAEVVRRTLTAAGVPLRGVAIVDGSGLSQSDRMTARALVSILAAADRSASVRPTLQASLPLAGVSGTLARRLLSGPAHAFVRAKTGSTDVASALVGYAGRYAFAIVMNARPWIDASRAHAAQDRFAQLVASLALAAG
jgi:D-alanyl-D-alanine carboxypeptidase/D-alanyl-D-alanine-endopeptidase (penicillin-binding protein 4)